MINHNNNTASELEALARTLAAKYSKEPMRQSDGGWLTSCPKHADDKTSLSLNIKDGKFLWHCHAGCSQDNVFAAIKPYLPSKSSSKKAKHIEKTYPYHDANDKLIVEKVRYFPKAFVIRKPNNNGDWIYKDATKNIDKSILYRLPQILATINDKQTIYICEGEKDADRLTAIGLAATCNLFGASKDMAKPKWNDENTRWLKGAENVTIFPHNDDAGRAHVHAIASSLYRADIPCKVVELPGLQDKQDVSDWLANGGTKEQLLELIDKTPCWQPDKDSELKDTDNQAQREKPKQSDLLAELAFNQGIELFHDSNDTTYASVSADSHKENWKLKSLGFSRWLRRLWRKTYHAGASTQTINDAVNTLDAEAAESNEYKIYIRIANLSDVIYVDLCDSDWQVVEINKQGWKVINNPPVKFLRTRGMLPQKVPISGGKASEKIAKLRTFINASDDTTWRLIVAWLLGAYTKGPFPVLIVTGEQGAAKSFLCRVLRQIIDPSSADMVTAPREARDVILRANNSYVVGLDNLSGITGWLSDLLSGISTGTASSERQLFSNDDEAFFKAKRPIVINGIDLALQNDLASRALLLSLPTISDDKRKTEDELLPEIAAVIPDILGGLFDVLSVMLSKLPDTKLDKAPRMADFARCIVAGESELVTEGWKLGDFLRTYAGNRDEAVELALDSDSFGAALKDFIVMHHEFTEWTGGWKDLINALAGRQNPPKDWPT